MRVQHAWDATFGAQGVDGLQLLAVDVVAGERVAVSLKVGFAGSGFARRPCYENELIVDRGETKVVDLHVSRYVNRPFLTGSEIHHAQLVSVVGPWQHHGQIAGVAREELDPVRPE